MKYNDLDKAIQTKLLDHEITNNIENSNVYEALEFFMSYYLQNANPYCEYSEDIGHWDIG